MHPAMFTAPLLTTVKTWKQPRCPSAEEWIKMWGVSERVVVVTLHHCVCVYEPSHWKRLILEKTKGKRRG